MEQTMWSWQYDSVTPNLESNLHLKTDVPIPTLPKTGPASLVRMLRASLNPVDYKVSEMGLVSRMRGFPATPGFEGIGRVVETTHPDFQEGDLVVFTLGDPLSRYGALSEYRIITAKEHDSAVKAHASDPALLDALAGTPVVGSTAYQVLEASKPGDRVFINGGSGGTGIFQIQLAKQKGCFVVTTCSTPNVSFVRDLGADEVIDYREQNVVETIKDIVEKEGAMFDLVVDNVGTDDQMHKQAHHFLSKTGRYFLVGVHVGSLGDLTKLMVILYGPGFMGGSQRKVQTSVGTADKETMSKVVSLVVEGKVKVVVNPVALGDVPKAFEMLKSQRTRGKLVVNLEGSA